MDCGIEDYGTFDRMKPFGRPPRVLPPLLFDLAAARARNQDDFAPHEVRTPSWRQDEDGVAGLLMDSYTRAGDQAGRRGSI